jgi:hypothetical protein
VELGLNIRTTDWICSNCRKKIRQDYSNYEERKNVCVSQHVNEHEDLSSHCNIPCETIEMQDALSNLNNSLAHMDTNFTPVTKRQLRSQK